MRWKLLHRGGAHFLKLTPAEKGRGWPLTEREMAAGRGIGALSATCKIASHPWTPGVTHRAQALEADWLETPGLSVVGVIVQLPDWKAMLAAIEAGGASDAEADAEAEGDD